MATAHKGHIFRLHWVSFIYRLDCIWFWNFTDSVDISISFSYNKDSVWLNFARKSLWKENLNNDSQQFYQYQQNEQSITYHHNSLTHEQIPCTKKMYVVGYLVLAARHKMNYIDPSGSHEVQHEYVKNWLSNFCSNNLLLWALAETLGYLQIESTSPIFI